MVMARVSWSTAVTDLVLMRTVSAIAELLVNSSINVTMTEN